MASSLADFPAGTPVFRTGDGSLNTVIGVFAGYGTGGGTNSLFKSDTPPDAMEAAAPSCFGGGGGCGCKETTPTVAGGAAQSRITTLAAQILNPLFRARRYGMSSYQAAAELPDFLWQPEAAKYNAKKSGFFGLRVSKNAGNAFPSPALPVTKAEGE